MKFFGVLFFISQVSFAGTCVVRTAAFDIGSSSTRMKIADVDTCLQKIVRDVFVIDDAVGYKQDLSTSGKNHLSDDVLKHGREVMTRFIQKAKQMGAKAFLGVATAAFRSAANAQKFLDEFKKDILVRIIDQEEEARLGFLAAISKDGVSLKKKIVVWDIGGGSQQIISRSADGNFTIFPAQTASIRFKELVVQKILNKDAKVVLSPNPLGRKNVDASVALATSLANSEFPSIQRSAIFENAEVIGIGGVWGVSVLNQTRSSVVTTETIEKTLLSRADFNDKKIGGKFAATDITNLALALGFMRALGIKKLRIENVNLADGLLVSAKR